jgi:hypothetical protein
VVSSDFAEFRITRIFRPRRIPAAIPNRSADGFRLRVADSRIYECDASKAMLKSEGKRDNIMLVLRFHVAIGMAATDA